MPSALPPLDSYRSPRGGSEPSMNGRRQTVVTKAFKKLDQWNCGAVSFDEVFRLLSMAPSLSEEEKLEVKGALSQVVSANGDGKMVITFPSFRSYYERLSAGVQGDTHFEQLVEDHWGYLELNDILLALQRKLILAGLKATFKDRATSSMTLQDFEASLQRTQCFLRPADMQRLFHAFTNPVGELNLDMLIERLMTPFEDTPRPKNNIPLMRASGSSTIPNTPFLQKKAELQVGPFTRPKDGPPRPSSMPSTRGKPPNLNSLAQPPPPHPMETDEILHHMETQLAQLRKRKERALSRGMPSSPRGSDEGPGGPLSDADLDAALVQMEARIQHVKTHKTSMAQAHAAAPQATLAPIDIPHWEHHKYGHHEITTPAWKPDTQITDMYGTKHSNNEYHYSSFGAGSHGHHLAHYHLNDYHGLAHHDFKQEEYHKKQYGSGTHGHWVPHLHGLGTKSHHAKHSYSAEDYAKNSYGESGQHSHWVPHLHGIGSP